MKVVFRTDSSAMIGSGHLMRCLTLANELNKRGAEVFFVTREHLGHVIPRIEAAGHIVYRLPATSTRIVPKIDDYSSWLGVSQEKDAEETLSALEGKWFDWIVVDHYGLDITWEKIMSPVVGQIMVIDDLANRKHDCNLLLDQNYFNDLEECRYGNLVPDSCVCLTGPRYALIQPEFYQLRSILPSHNGHIARVLISFGGCDNSAQIRKVLEALSHPDLSHLIVDVVIGANDQDFEGIKAIVSGQTRITFHRDLPTLAGLMARADLMIGSGGTTTWERMCLGVPSLVISIAENQQKFTEMLALNGFQMFLPLGKNASVIDWYEAIYKLSHHPELVKEINKKAIKLVDGKGCKRVTHMLLGAKLLDIRVRPVMQSDKWLLFDWVNEPEVRLQSFKQVHITEEEHNQWFDTKFADPNCLILIAEDESGLPLGQVRFEIDKNSSTALIDISVERELRGLGIAEKLLRKSLIHWDSAYSGIKLIAEVRDKNSRSQQLFRRLDFSQSDSGRSGVMTFERYPLSILERDTN